MGVNERFTTLFKGAHTPKPGEVILNHALAEQLNTQPGQTIILRFVQPSALSQDMPVGFEEDGNTTSLRVTVAGVNDNRFSLQNTPQATMNVIADRDWLAQQLDITGKANLLICDKVIAEIDRHWQLSDAQLTWEKREDGRNQLASSRVFIDKPIVDALKDLPGERVLTYFVNTIAHGDRQAPYSMVAAIDNGLSDNQIAINAWLAQDLGAKVGDEIVLTYFIADAGRKLQEASTTLTVSKIVPIEGRYADRGLVPNFPGLDEVDQISDWDGGPMIDRSRIRDKDEDYWDDYRATPKAFVSLKTGQSLWANRYGTLTSIRFGPSVTKQDVLSKLDPSMVGLVPRDVRTPALNASRATVDFGMLFLSLSFFIIVSAVLLTGMLFAFGVEQRAKEIGTLTAVGLPVPTVRRLIMFEGAAVAIIGSTVGVLGGIIYTLSVLAVLAGSWSGAVGGAAIRFHIGGASMLFGFVSGLIVAVLAMRLSIRSQTNSPIRSLLQGVVGNKAPTAGRSRLGVAGGCLLFLGAAVLLVTTDFNDAKAAAGAFFGVGFMALSGGLCAVYSGLAVLAGRASDTLNTWKLVFLNTTRRRGRSLSVVALLASGVFLVIAVAGFYQSPPTDPSQRDTGTGGFTLIAEATLPILYDLNTDTGREQYGLEPDELPPGSVVPMRVSAGDDASCLNLNQVPSPRLLGVDPRLLAMRDAFTINHPDGWAVLDQPLTDGIIPAVADTNTAQWALKLKVGDTFMLTDDQGNDFKARLVATIDNSILQGSLIVSERAFTSKHPGSEGYRMLLIDTPTDRIPQTSEALTQTLADLGVSITPTSTRLAEYNRVQNTYLSIFQALGGLGLLLGTAGLGVVVLRNMIDRRSELAMMRAIGFTMPRQRRIVLMEHAVLLATGLVVGIVAALIAVVPAWRNQNTLTPLVITVVSMWLFGLVFVYLATRRALRGSLIPALRGE